MLRGLLSSAISLKSAFLRRPVSGSGDVSGSLSAFSRQFAVEKEASMASSEVSIRDLGLDVHASTMVPGTRYDVSLRFLVVIKLNNSP